MLDCIEARGSEVRVGESGMTSSGRAAMPYADAPITQYLAKQIDIQASKGKSQRQIAQEIGYEKPNMISMFKTGEVKVPLDKIPLLARSLNVDAAFLFKLAMQQYWPEMGKTIADIFGTVLDQEELKVIEAIREVTKTKGATPPVTDDMLRQIQSVFA